MPSLSVSDITVGEADGFADVVIRLDAAATTAISVDYTYDGSTAGSNDFVTFGGKLTFAPGETSKTVRVQLREDSAIEAPELFFVGLRNPVGATIERNWGAVTIIDNDTTGATPQLFVDDLFVDEKQGTAQFVVRLGQLLGQSSATAVTVAYTTADGTALAGQDYTTTSGTLSFAPGESVKTVSVPLLDDGSAEGVERFQLLLSNAVNAGIGDGNAQAEIGLSDGAGSAQPRISMESVTTGEGEAFADLVVRLHAPSTSTVTVDVTYDGSTAGSNDFVTFGGTLSFAPGETVKPLRVQLREDTAAEAREVFFVGLRNVTNAQISTPWAAVTVVDNDTVVDLPQLFVDPLIVDEKQGTASFVVRLGHQLGEVTNGTVTVDYTTVDGSALASMDYLPRNGTLSFAPGESAKTVVVDLVDDTVAEGLERFSLQLSNPVNAGIGRGQALAEIGLSDGVGSAQPRISISEATVGESDGFVTLLVSLHAPSTSPITVDVTYDGSTAGSNDFVTFGGTLSFAPGETTKPLRVEIRDDTAAEGRESFFVGLRNPTNATIAEAWGRVNVIDDDTVADQPRVYVEDVVVDERAGTARFVVRLGQTLGEATNGTVSVDYSTRDGTATAGQDYAASHGTLVFVPGESARTVVVDLVDDTLPEAAERFGLFLSNPVNAVLGDLSASAEIGASDSGASAQPRVSISGTRAGESDTFAELQVTLSAPAANPVWVDVSYDSSTAGSNDFVTFGGQLFFAPGETTQRMRVELRPDTLAEATEVFSVLLRNPVNATLGESVARVEIVDDDGARPLLSHGRSDDLYTVDSSAVDFIEAVDGGFDVVRSSVSFTLPDTLEGVMLTGSALNATGNAAGNFFTGNASANRIDGAAGIDTMAYPQAQSAYVVTGDVGQRTVTGAGSGTDTLLSIERLRFADTLVAWDTSAGGNTYGAYALLNAAFNQAPDAAMLGRWTAQLDRLGGSVSALAQAMIHEYAPGVSNESLVAYLWFTVVGTPIQQAELAAFVGLIENGSYTQATLAELAALHPLNTADFAPLIGQPMAMDPGYFVMPGE